MRVSGIFPLLGLEVSYCAGSQPESRWLAYRQNRLRELEVLRKPLHERLRDLHLYSYDRPETLNALLERANKSTEDVNLFVFHQSSKFMLDALDKKSKIPEEKFYLLTRNSAIQFLRRFPLPQGSAQRWDSEGGPASDVGRFRCGVLLGRSYGRMVLGESLFQKGFGSLTEPSSPCAGIYRSPSME